MSHELREALKMAALFVFTALLTGLALWIFIIRHMEES